MFHVCHYVPTTTTTTTTCHRPFILTLSATISLSLRAICVFCHLLLTAPFSGDLDAPSRLPQWERSLPPPHHPLSFPLAWHPQSSSSPCSSRVVDLHFRISQAYLSK